MCYRVNVLQSKSLKKMAKSLRSKSKRFHRTLKRTNSVYSIIEEQRLQRLAAAQNNLKPQDDQPDIMNDNNTMDTELTFKSRLEKDQLFMNRNQLKKKMKSKKKK